MNSPVNLFLDLAEKKVSTGTYFLTKKTLYRPIAEVMCGYTLLPKIVCYAVLPLQYWVIYVL